MVSWTSNLGNAVADAQIAAQFEQHKCPEREIAGGRATINIEDSPDHVDYCVVRLVAFAFALGFWFPFPFVHQYASKVVHLLEPTCGC